MYIISSTRNPNLSDFQSVASFLPSRSLVPAMTACFYAGRSSYNPSTIPTVRILNESGPWVSPQILRKKPKWEGKCLKFQKRTKGSWMILAMEDSFWIILFLIGFRFQFKSSFRSYQKWSFKSQYEQIGKKHEGLPILSSPWHSWMHTYDMLNHNIPMKTFMTHASYSDTSILATCVVVSKRMAVHGLSYRNCIFLLDEQQPYVCYLCLEIDCSLYVPFWHVHQDLVPYVWSKLLIDVKRHHTVLPICSRQMHWLWNLILQN